MLGRGRKEKQTNNRLGVENTSLKREGVLQMTRTPLLLLRLKTLKCG